MSELERSKDYFRKICLIHENIVPTQTEVKYRMGDDLANVLFDSILPALKPYLGLRPPLNGPGDDLWLSPSDLLIGKVKLKPPLTSKHIKALTHEGILDIGSVVEQKRDNEYQLDKEKALIEKEMIIKYMAAKELREAVLRAREEKDKEQAAIIAKLEEDFKIELQTELQTLSDKLKMEQDKAVEAGKKEKEAEMQIKLDIAVQDAVTRSTEQFARELYKVSKKLHEHFWYHIRKEKKKLKEAINFERQHGQQKLEQLRAEFQCENIANIMYVLANERRRCICEKQAIENNFLARLSMLEKEQEERNEKLGQYIQKYEISGQKIKVREAILFDIIKQFQKFIYFVLRAVPMQAEYLLNVEQLMIYELTKTALDSKPELFEEEMGEDEQEYETDNIESGTGVSNLSGSSSHLASTKSGGRNVTEIDASKFDFHNCDNVSRRDSIDKSLKENEDLPYFLFNENLYVREDFRNMISQGIKISKSHELWSYKNNEIIEQIEPDVINKNLSDNLTIQERINLNEADDNNNNNKERQTKKSTINVRFSTMIVHGEEKVLDSRLYIDEHPRAKINSLDTTKRDSILSAKSVDMRQERPSKLELARDSIELLIERSTHQDLSHRSMNKLLGSKIQNSLISCTRKSFDEKLLSARDMANRRESKIELHRDSVELLKQRESVLVRNSTAIRDAIFKDRKRSIGIQCDSNHKSVAISHIEIIPDDSKRKVSIVSFHNVPKIIPDKLSISEEIIKEPIYHRPPTADRVYRMPEKAFKIIGDKDMNEYLQTQDEFTSKRIQSFIRIFKNSPSLRDLFTEAAKN